MKFKKRVQASRRKIITVIMKRREWATRISFILKKNSFFQKDLINLYYDFLHLFSC